MRNQANATCRWCNVDGRIKKISFILQMNLKYRVREGIGLNINVGKSSVDGEEG